MRDRNKHNLCMLLFTMILFVAAGALLFQGCASVPEENPALTRAKAAYAKAKADPGVVANAAVPLYEAEKILKSAEAAASEAELKHLSYLAEKHTALAVATAEQRLAEAERKKLAAERERIIIEQREQQARTAQYQAQVASKEVDRQRMEAEMSAAEASESRKRAESSATLARQLEQELAELKAKKTDRGYVLTLGDILFAFGKSDLLPGAQRTMDRLAEFLSKNPTMKVSLEGHTDSVGSNEYNLMLSRQRAESVRSAIVERGVNAERISVKGLGLLYPVASNADPAGRQQNRRVEVVILSGEQSPPRQ